MNKLGISKKVKVQAVVRSGCGRSSTNQCGGSYKNG